MNSQDIAAEDLLAHYSEDVEVIVRRTERRFADRRASLLDDTLVFILAGGQGERLSPLTRDRTKGAVPFGGVYRLIDFTLSNCLHSRLRHICILPQYKFASLERHLRLGWHFFRPEMGSELALLPPQQRVSGEWYQGTADAIYQNIYTLQRENPQYTLVLSSDHIYRMDYGQLLRFHTDHAADLTIACVEVPLHEAHHFGIVSADQNGRCMSFIEKPVAPPNKPIHPGHALASMGIYVFNTEILIEMLEEDASSSKSQHDFGRDIIPLMLEREKTIAAYDVQEEEYATKFYWRDIGTIDAYWQASMDLLASPPLFDPDAPDWAVHTCHPARLPVRILQQRHRVSDSLICAGTHITDARVERSILSPGVKVECDAEVVDSVLLDGVQVGAGARIRRAIIDKNVTIPVNCDISAVAGADNSCIYVSPQGISVVPRGADLEAECKVSLASGTGEWGPATIPHFG